MCGRGDSASRSRWNPWCATSGCTLRRSMFSTDRSCGIVPVRIPGVLEQAGGVRPFGPERDLVVTDAGERDGVGLVDNGAAPGPREGLVEVIGQPVAFVPAAPAHHGPLAAVRPEPVGRRPAL